MSRRKPPKKEGVLLVIAVNTTKLINKLTPEARNFHSKIHIEFLFILVLSVNENTSKTAFREKKIVKIATCKKLYNILLSALVPLEEIA